MLSPLFISTVVAVVSVTAATSTATLQLELQRACANAGVENARGLLAHAIQLHRGDSNGRSTEDAALL